MSFRQPALTRKQYAIQVLHFTASILFLFSGCAFIGLAFFRPERATVILFVYDGFSGGRWEWPVNSLLFLSGFPLLTGLFELTTFAVATSNPNLFFRDWLANHAQFIRWVEYSVTASWISVGVLILCGVRDINYLIQHFFLHTSMNLFGLLCEVTNYHKEKLAKKGVANYGLGLLPWMCFFLGWVPYVAAIYARIDQFVFAATQPGAALPVFVWVAFLGYQFMEFSFPLILAFSLGKWWIFRDYENTEIAFLVCSFTAKVFFEVNVFSGILGQTAE